MLTYKELKPILYFVARKFANYKYDVDELINEVWLIGRVQKLKDIRFAYRRIYYDIVEYMRTQEGRKKVYYSQKPDIKYRTNFKSYNRELEYSTYEIFMGKEDEEFAEIDFKNELELSLLQGFNCLERFVVKLKLEGFTHKKVGKIIGVSESRISQMLTSIGTRLLFTIKRNGIGYNEKNIEELIDERIKNGKKTSNKQKETTNSKAKSQPVCAIAGTDT